MSIRLESYTVNLKNGLNLIDFALFQLIKRLLKRQDNVNLLALLNSVINSAIWFCTFQVMALIPALYLASEFNIVLRSLVELTKLDRRSFVIM